MFNSQYVLPMTTKMWELRGSGWQSFHGAGSIFCCLFVSHGSTVAHYYSSYSGLLELPLLVAHSQVCLSSQSVGVVFGFALRAG